MNRILEYIENMFYKIRFSLITLKPHAEYINVPDGTRTYIDGRNVTFGNLTWKRGYRKLYEKGLDPMFRTDRPWEQDESPKEFITTDDTDIVLTLPAKSIRKTAYLYSNFTIKYGTVRALVKSSNTKGAWSAFWLFGKDGTPEHDMFEHCGQWKNKLNVTHHWGYDYEGIRGKKMTSQNGRYNKNFKPSEEYYLYEVELTPYKAVYRINGETVRVMRRGISSGLNHILFNIAKGEYCESYMNKPLEKQAQMRVRYLEIFKIR